jgi:hypothetical protein
MAFYAKHLLELRDDLTPIHASALDKWAQDPPSSESVLINVEWKLSTKFHRRTDYAGSTIGGRQTQRSTLCSDTPDIMR